ncbi:NEW3 domain-containing protein [Flexivirga alba]|uniref:Alpha-galactosidase n=1 Tax=Flexivirga alba TaxID=702742 RepID=A0ABW2AC14_9MICO
MHIRTVTVVTAAVLALAGAGATPAMASGRSPAPPGKTTATAAASGGSYNGLALTPPMGWNDWSYYQCNIDESLIVAQAKALVSTGLAKKGYDTVTTDDCWMAGSRAADGSLQADPVKFPHGMAWLGKQIHALGLKFGIYEDEGTQTCGGYPGTWGHETQDANTFASWGVDYVKLDGCNVPTQPGRSSLQTYRSAYEKFSGALVATGRHMVFSDSMPAYFEGSSDWMASISDASKVSNLWREGADTALGQQSGAAKWSAIAYNYGYNVGLGQYAGPGHWNDPDFLLAGDDGLSTTEIQSQMSLWAEMAAPLISSTDLTKLSPQALAVLGNKRIIAVDQDPLGVQGHIVQQGTAYDVLTKPLANGDVSVVLFNKGTSSQTISTTAGAAGLGGSGPFQLTDLVDGRVTASNGVIAADVPAHGTVMYRVHRGASTKLAPAVSPSFDNGTVGTGQATPVRVTVTNNGPTMVNTADVRLSVPSGWTVSPAGSALRTIRPGGSATATFQVDGKTPPPGPHTDSLTATVDYRARSASATITGADDIFSNVPYPNLRAAYNNVGVTDLSTIAKGNFDGDGNSFSAEQLAAAGVTPGSTITSNGATFTWPDAAAGEPDNVEGSGAVVTTSGQGSKLAFLGSEAGDAQSAVTVTYTDGTTSTGQLGFPNWSFSPADEFGSTVAVSVKGRNTPSGYADAAYDYRVFENSVSLDPSKQVASVTLPNNASIHIFAMTVQQ